MTEKQVIKYIADNLTPQIQSAILFGKTKNPNLIYSIDWLIAITMRETGNKIALYASRGFAPKDIWPLMKGDYSKRGNDVNPSYHGYGLTQIDIDSFPDFVKSGDWKDPLKCYIKSIAVLEGKRKYIQSKVPNLAGNDLFKAITAAYNCGEGHVVKALSRDKSVDSYTHQGNYSAEVWRFRELYNSMLK